MHPKVSIIVPVYNVEKYLAKCIDSILVQTFTDLECILVNDCSTDTSPKICEDYAMQDSRIKIIHKKNNEGLPLARKTGFENSTGDYIQFVDSDDWIEPDMTKKLYTSAINSCADIVTCDFYIDSTEGYKYGFQIIDTDNNFNNFGFIHCCYTVNKIFRKNIIRSINFPLKGNFEDRVITQQAIFYAKKIVHVPYPLYHYIIRQGSMSREISIVKYAEWRDNILLTINFLRKNLKEKFVLKEKNINNYVNRFKGKVLRNSVLRKDTSLFKFYPESKFYRWLFVRLVKKSIQFVIPHGFFLLYKKYLKKYTK